MASTNDEITVKVAGLGHKLTLSLPADQTVLDLKEEIFKQTSIPSAYQRLICHGKNLDCDNDTLHELDRTKLLLLHNASYNQDKETLQKILTLQAEIDQLVASTSHDATVKHELATQICCKLDSIDVHGSDTLRQLRKAALQSAQQL